MTFHASIEIPAPPERVFGALADSTRLARWWGPAGFTNTIRVFEFKPGGRWCLVMHGPDGADYPNEAVFSEIAAPSKVVISHVSEPKFSLAITLTAAGKGTVVNWAQTFDDPELGRKMEKIVVPANQQNLERWSAEVKGKYKIS